MTRTATLIIAAVLVAVAPAQAQAGWKTERAREIAYAVWPELATVCPNGKLDVSASTANDQAGEDTFAAAWASPGVCVINFTPRLGQLSDFEPYCTTFLHEAGHIIGRGHGRGIMSAFPGFARTTIRVARRGHISRARVEWDGTDRRCAKRGRPYMEAHGLL